MGLHDKIRDQVSVIAYAVACSPQRASDRFIDISTGLIMEIIEEEIKLDEKVLRKLLWLKHGCSIESLYGDDGEMQCSNCLIDFKRDSIERIDQGLTKKQNAPLNSALSDTEMKHAL